jgi:hypothetical protein
MCYARMTFFQPINGVLEIMAIKAMCSVQILLPSPVYNRKIVSCLAF